MSFFSNLSKIIMDNQFLLTALGLSGAGVITFWLKDVPKLIFNMLKRELTTELVVTSQNIIFFDILEWIEKKYKNSNFRKLKVRDKINDDCDTLTSIGYGFHFIKYKNKLLYITLAKDSGNQTDRDKESICITILGRNKRFFSDFVDTVKYNKSSAETIKLYTFSGSYWSYYKRISKRPLDTIFLEKYKRDIIFSTLKSFIENESWYVKHAIPYQIGILLYGAPGTGKSSIIKAIAGYLNYPIYYLSAEKLGLLDNATEAIPDKSVLVIEDIDCNVSSHSRKPKKDNFESNGADKIYNNLSTILNSLDGLYATHGRILITTTNHINKLDEALLRPGRIDLKIEVGYVNNEILNQFIDSFYPDTKIDFSNVSIKSNITVAMLQDMVLQKYSDKEFLNNIIDIEENCG